VLATLFVLVFFAAVFGVFKPYIAGVKRWQFGLAAFVALLLVGATAEPPTNSSGTPAANSTATPEPLAQSPSEQATATPSPREPESEWSYSTEKDEMRGGESRYAQLQAVNTLDLDFPYGEQRGRVLVRQSPKFGFDILVGVPSGQIMCNSFSNSHISVKFDDGPIRNYGCTDASDGSTSMVFIEGAKGFLSKLKASKKMVVEAEFYQNGLQQMSFNTANLKWGE
jgi:hypothetical protein